MSTATATPAAPLSTPANSPDQNPSAPAPKPSAPDLKPLAIGELIDRAAAMWRQNFGAFFRLYLVFQLGAYILQKVFELAMATWFPLVRGGQPLLRAMETDPASVLSQYAIAAPAIAALLFGVLWLSWFVAVAGSRFAIRRQLGQPVTMKEAVSRSVSRFGTLTGALVLSSVWGLVVVTVLCIPGGVIGGLTMLSVTGGTATATGATVGLLAAFGLMLLGMIVASLWFVLRFLLTAQVIAMEDVGAWQALKRSGQLVSGRVGSGLMNVVKIRATVLLTIVFVILLVVNFVAGLPAVVVQLVYANPFDPTKSNPDAIPQLFLIPAQLLQVTAQAAFSPLYAVFAALFYVDMRVRREGLDLELKLSA